MVDWQQEILEAFNQGKTIQFKNTGEEWHDFERQNQLDKPNINYGYREQWRIKPDYDTERKEILEKSDRGHISLDMVDRMSTASSKEIKSEEEAAQQRFPTYKGDIGLNASANYGFQEGAKWQANRMYTKDQLVLFGGFCLGKRMTNPSISGSEMWEAWEKEFKNG